MDKSRGGVKLYAGAYVGAVRRPEPRELDTGVALVRHPASQRIDTYDAGIGH